MEAPGTNSPLASGFPSAQAELTSVRTGGFRPVMPTVLSPAGGTRGLALFCGKECRGFRGINRPGSEVPGRIIPRSRSRVSGHRPDGGKCLFVVDVFRPCRGEGENSVARKLNAPPDRTLKHIDNFTSKAAIRKWLRLESNS